MASSRTHHKTIYINSLDYNKFFMHDITSFDWAAQASYQSNRETGIKIGDQVNLLPDEPRN